MQETPEMQVQFLDRDDPLEEGLATHSSILAWRMHRQRSLWGTVTGLQRVGHD